MSDVKHKRNQNVGFSTLIIAFTFGEPFIFDEATEGSGKMYVCPGVRIVSCPCEMVFSVLQYR